MVEQGKPVREEDQEPPLPPYAAEIICHFFALDRWRRSGMAGPERLLLCDIEDYCRAYRVVLELADIECLREVDDLYLEAYYNRPK